MEVQEVTQMCELFCYYNYNQNSLREKQNKIKQTNLACLEWWGEKKREGPMSSAMHWIKQNTKLLEPGVLEGPDRKWKVWICGQPFICQCDASGTMWEPIDFYVSRETVINGKKKDAFRKDIFLAWTFTRKLMAE